MADVGMFRGTGGSAWTLDLPLPEPLRDQLLKGDLVPSDDGAKVYLAELEGRHGFEVGESGPEIVEQDEPEPEPEPAGRPPEAGPGSSRKAWAAYAEQQGIPVSDDDTRDDIIAKMND